LVIVFWLPQTPAFGLKAVSFITYIIVIKMTRKSYDSDLTDAQWAILKPFLEKRHIFGWGRPRIVDLREVANAIFYLTKTGCQWRSLPHDFPAWPVVFYYFRKWKKTGVWQQCNQALTQMCREIAGRHPEPTAACIDSQSVKGSSESGGEASGFDGNKKVKGRKRHIVTDVMGYVLGATVHAANEAETTTAPELVTQVFALYATIVIIFADLGYKEPFIKWLKDTFKVTTEISKKEPGFKPARKRWVVERTFAWLSRQRRMARDYERTPESSEALIYISMIRIMLKQLSPEPNPWRKGAAWSPILN
jgi:putative transposase